MEFQLQDIIVHVKGKVLRCSQVNAVATMFLKDSVLGMFIFNGAYSLRDIWEHQMLPRAPQTAFQGDKKVAYNFILYYKSWKANK